MSVRCLPGLLPIRERRVMGFSRTPYSILLALIVCAGTFFLSTWSAWAQSDVGTVIGQVTDPSGAAIAGADVKITDPTTNATQSTTTNEVGRYSFVSVPPSTYDVTVSHAGFTQARIQAQKVSVGLTLTLNATLQIGATSTVVEVQAAVGAELQTLNATVGSTIDAASLQMMPNLGRDASALSVLQVGVSPNGNVAGTATDQNGFQLDGGNNSDDMAGTNTTYVPGNGYIGTG